MSKAYVIGDIHGCYYTLISAINKINKTREKDDVIIFLGDYFDRGKYNAEVYFYLRQLEQDENYNVIFIRGNHEQMQLDAIKSRSNEHLWFCNGGDVTSEHFTEASISPSEVKNWIEKMPYAYHHEELNFFAVHSYLPHVFIEDFNKEDQEECIWDRHKNTVGNKVFHGHTPHINFVKIDGNDINLDTGCVFDGGLSFATITPTCYGITTIPTHGYDKRSN